MVTIHEIYTGGRVPALEAQDLTVQRRGRPFIKDLSIVIPVNSVVAVIGPSGSGKGTLLRTFSRLVDLDHGTRVSGQVLLHGEDIRAPFLDPSEVRRRVAFIARDPNPFPATIFDNMAFGPKVHGSEEELGSVVEAALRRAGLWDEVGYRLNQMASDLNRGHLQQLCIARALAVEPEVLVMDEPASSMDPKGAQRIEELVYDLKLDYTIVLTTHNMQQAARLSDYTAFLDGGELVEYGPTETIFTNPREPRTEAYITGRFA